MPNRRSVLAAMVAAWVAFSSNKLADAKDFGVKPIYLHIYSNTRGTNYDQERQNRKVTSSTATDWVRVVTLLIVPDNPVFIRLPGGRDPDINISGRVDRRGTDKIQVSLSVSWDDSYITEQHQVSGLISVDELHPSSTLHCRYIFSHLKDAYDALDLVVVER